MIITDHFVYIHYPKTGGTFVTETLMHLYGTSAMDVCKHGSCREVPVEHGHKPLISTLRHPLSRLVSHYEFRYWQRYTRDDFGIWDASDIKVLYPSFPDLTFREYVELWNDHWIPAKTTHLAAQVSGRLGVETFDFARFFTRDPDAVMVSIAEDPDAYVQRDRLKEDMFPVRFLDMNNLNNELHSFLAELGWSSTALRFILDAPRLCPREPERKTTWEWQEYYDDSLLDTVTRRELALIHAYEHDKL